MGQFLTRGALTTAQLLETDSILQECVVLQCSVIKNCSIGLGHAFYLEGAESNLGRPFLSGELLCPGV